MGGGVEKKAPPPSQLIMELPLDETSMYCINGIVKRFD